MRRPSTDGFRLRRSPGRVREGAQPCPTEHAEQVAVRTWARLRAQTYPELDLLFAVPNGARVQWTQAKRLKAEGLAAGVPVFCLPVARGQYHGLFIGMKRQHGGVLSPMQRWWGTQLRAQGYLVIVAHGADRAIAWLEGYLRMGMGGKGT